MNATIGQAQVEQAVADAFRQSWGQVVATLIGITGDWDLAEECAQDAFTVALETWGQRGIPDRPGAWLTSVARNRSTDVLRRRAVGAAKLREVAVSQRDQVIERAEDSDGPGGGAGPDDRLRLIFTCCHPALPLEAQVALTLRTLLGLTTAEIARAFIVTEPAMAQRLVRAKRKIRNAGIPYRVPPARLMPQRTQAVLGVLYLLLNEGHSASRGPDLVRPALTDEALRLARLLHTLMPQDPEVGGLLALILMHDARRAARVDAAGDLVPLEEQDRTLWDSSEIAEAIDILKDAMQQGHPGPYQIQAAIVACHAVAIDPADTDWRQIAALYERLAGITPSPVIELNRAVAVAMAEGPAAGLVIVDSLAASQSLPGYHLVPAVRADLLRRLDRLDEAAECYRQALDLVTTDSERRFLARRLTETTQRR